MRSFNKWHDVIHWVNTKWRLHIGCSELMIPSALESSCWVQGLGVIKCFPWSIHLSMKFILLHEWNKNTYSCWLFNIISRLHFIFMFSPNAQGKYEIFVCGSIGISIEIRWTLSICDEHGKKWCLLGPKKLTVDLKICKKVAHCYNAQCKT